MNRIHFFDLNYFKYCFKHLFKSSSIIVFSIIFFVLIISYSLIVPSIAQTTAYELYSVPIAMLFIVFAIALISVCLTINLFKNQIEDGSELIVLSKCLLRREIINVKIAIYLLYSTGVLVIGALLSLLSYINGNGYEFSYLLVFVGIIICGLIISLLFGSITLFFCFFYQKIKALLCGVGIAFLMLFYSIATMLTSSNYINNLENGYLPLEQTISLNFEDNKDKNIVNLYSIDTVNANKNEIDYTGVNAGDQINSEYLASLNNASTLMYYLNFGSQFSQMLMLGQPIKDLGKVSDTLKVFNYPTKLKTTMGDMDNLYNNPIKISLIDFDSITSNQNQPNFNYQQSTLNYVIPEYRFKSFLNTTYKVNGKPGNKEYDKKYYVYDIDEINVDSGLWDVLYNDAKDFIKYEFYSQLKDTTNTTLRISKKPYQSFIEYFFKQYFIYKNGDVNNDEFIQYLIDVSYSAYYKLRYEYNNINIFNLIDPTIQINPQLTFGQIINFDNPSNQNLIKKLNWLLIDTENNKITKNTKVKDLIDFIADLGSGQNAIEPYKTIYNQLKYESKNSLELLTLLGVIGVDFYPTLQPNGLVNQDINEYFPTRFTYKNSFTQEIDISDLTGTDDDYYTLGYRLSLNALNSNTLVSPVRIDVDFFFRTSSLFVVWTIISIALFVVMNYIYSRKDVY